MNYLFQKIETKRIKDDEYTKVGQSKQCKQCYNNF